MSTRSRQKRTTHRKTPQTTPGRSKTLSTADELQVAQQRLDKAAEAFRAAQSERRDAVRKAWAAGTPATEMAGLLGVSRQKVYDILGGVPGTKTGPIP